MQLLDAERSALSGDPAARRAVLFLALARDGGGGGRGTPRRRPARRKKKTVGAIYGFHGLRTIEDLQVLLETAAIETLALENTIARNRAIAGFAAVGAKLIEVGDHEERLRALEASQQGQGRAADETDAFPDDS